MSQLPPLSSGSRRLVLVRHGETDWNQQGKMQGGGFDIELNDNGRKQAVFVADALQAMTFGAVASSHLARASQTADVIHCSQEQQQQTAVERVSRMAFGEMRFGVFEGVTMRGPESTDEWKSRYKCVNSQLMLDVTVPYPGGGESTLDVATRATQGLYQLFADYPTAHTICVVGHGRTNKILLASLLYDDILAIGEIQQDNTCINVVDMDPKGTWTAHIMNSMDHMKVPVDTNG
jgi:broad specificity phosphatase PhoE